MLNCCKKWIRMPLLALVTLCVLSGMFPHVSAAAEQQPRVVRVGFFAFDGYHDMDAEGNKSGYGYEVLQQMKRYENWQYAYFGYDRSWDDMLTMLENGEIDMVTSAGKYPDRLEKFDFSGYDIGHNSTLLTVRADDTRYTSGAFKGYNGMRIGMLYGNERNNALATFAKENNFTYTCVYYESSKELEQALQTGKAIDAIVTSSLRKIENEKILEEFMSTEFYVIVKKGNQKLLDEINHALIHMNNDDPQWKTRLRMKYYQVGISNEIMLSAEDAAVIERLKSDQKVFQVLVRPDNPPYSYLEEGKMVGIIPELFQMAAEKALIQYAYLPVTTSEEYQKALESGQADMIADGMMSLQNVENLGMDDVGSYMTTPISTISYRQTAKDVSTAAVPEALAKTLHSYFGEAVELVETQSFTEGIDRLRDGSCDMAILPSLRAERIQMADYKNQYSVTVLPNQTISISLLVKEGDYRNLSSLLAKACASINTEDVERLQLRYKNNLNQTITLATVFYGNPGLFMGIAVVVIFSVGSSLVVTLKRKRELAGRNEQLEETNEFLREKDPLTGGYNRDGFLNAMERMREREVDFTKYTVLFVDIKGFKAINEMIGVQQGNKLLLKLYDNMNKAFQPELSAKVDADSFAFLVGRDKRDFPLLLKTLELENTINGKLVRIQCQCGVHEMANGDMPVAQMLHYAKIARFFLTDDSPEPYMLFESYMSNAYIDQAEVLISYENAIRNNEFEVFYQPIVHTNTGKIASAEALVRWKRPNNNTISPALFVPVLEKNGCISKLDAYVENSVYQFLLNRQEECRPVVPVSVNLSQMDFYDKKFMEHIANNDRFHKLPVELLRYELTETAYTEVEDRCKSFVDQLRERGTMFVLDDFGSGYSSFGMIQNYQFGILKIDMSFIRQMLRSEKVKVIVRTIIEMCHQLGIRTVAEGVENAEEVALLREMECDYIQGYYFSKPLSENAFVEYLEKHAS